MMFMRRNKLYLLSVLYFCFSILISMLQTYNITGFSISEIIGRTPINLLGIIFFFIAILLFMAGRDDEGFLEKKIAKVFDASDGKSKDYDAAYTFVDPSGYRITLGEMRKQINEFRREKGGDEYVRIMREEYSPILHDIIDNSNEAQRKVAWGFLEVLGEKRQNEERNFGLTRDQEREIKETFRDYNGTLSSRQRDILGKYGFNIEGRKDNHKGFRYRNSGFSVIASSSPSDWRTGRNLASDIIKVIEKARRAEYEKQQKEKEEKEKKIE